MEDVNRYPRGKAQFSSFEDSENEQHQRWARQTPEERLLHLFRLMDIFKSRPHHIDPNDKFTLKRIQR